MAAMLLHCGRTSDRVYQWVAYRPWSPVVRFYLFLQNFRELVCACFYRHHYFSEIILSLPILFAFDEVHVPQIEANEDGETDLFKCD